MPEITEISLFPLRLVMFPGGRVNLQIFERRYIDLVRNCMRSNTGFGICLLKQGEEVEQSSQQSIHRTGTYASIVDWDQLENGLLGITVEGSRKFKISKSWQASSGLLTADVIFSETGNLGGDPIPVDEQFSGLAELLQSLESHPAVERKNQQIDYNNLWDLGWRLSELIPIEAEKKQELLELDDAWERIENIEQLVSDMANDH